MRQKRKRFLGILLSLALVLGLMPGMSLTAYADDTPPYAQYKNTTTEITFDGKSWYLINYDDTTVTLLAKECVASSKYNESGSFVEYSSNPTVKTAIDNWYKTNITADAKKAVSGGAMFLLTKEEANAITNAEVRKDATAATSAWWLCSQGLNAYDAACVYAGSGYVSGDGLGVNLSLGVRPALTLNLSSVIFSSESNTFSLKQTIAAENVTVTYGDTDKKVSASVTKPATSGGAISYTVKTGSEDFIAVDSTTGALTIKKVPSDGRAYVIVTAAESGNYGKTTKECYSDDQ